MPRHRITQSTPTVSPRAPPGSAGRRAPGRDDFAIRRYERVVATVLYSRYQAPADIDKVKRELGVIAYGMHTGAGLGRRPAHAEGRGDLPRSGTLAAGLPGAQGLHRAGRRQRVRGPRGDPALAQRSVSLDGRATVPASRTCRFRSSSPPSGSSRGRGTAGRGVPRSRGDARVAQHAVVSVRTARRHVLGADEGDRAAGSTARAGHRSRHRPAAGARRRRTGASRARGSRCARRASSDCSGCSSRHDRQLPRRGPGGRSRRPSAASAIRAFRRIAGGCRTRTCSASSRSRPVHSRWGATRRRIPSAETTSSRNTSSTCPSTTSRALSGHRRAVSRVRRRRAVPADRTRTASVESRIIRSGGCRSTTRWRTAGG